MTAAASGAAVPPPQGGRRLGTTATGTPRTALGPDSFELVVPADPAYLAVIRTAAAGTAARLDLTLDEIEDLRIAVDEACAVLLGDAPRHDDRLVAVFTLQGQELEVLVQGPALVLPPRESFAWTVLEALVGRVETGGDDSGSWVRLIHGSSRREA